MDRATWVFSSWVLLDTCKRNAMTRTAALTTLLLALSACNQPPPEQPPVSAKSCEDFVERICTESSHVSPICKSMQKAAELLTPETCAVALTSVHTSIQKIAEKRRACTELTERVCRDLGPDSQGCSTAQSTSKSYPNERCQQMLGQYAEVLEGLKKRTATQAATVSQDKLDKLASAETSLAFGPADAKVTVVGVADFQCPYSARALPTVRAIKDKYGQRVRFVYRLLPQPQHRNAHIAAQGALAAQAQGKFWEYHNIAFDNQSQLGRESLERYAAQIGMNVPKFKKALDDRTYLSAVDSDLKLAQEAGVERTPALFVNGQRVADPFDLAAVEQSIEAALKLGS